MHELSKFKVFTIVFLCMFVFVIGAIYTNTKEVTQMKLQNNGGSRVNENASAKYKQASRALSDDEFAKIYERIDNLENRVNDVAGMSVSSSNGDKMNCKIQGIMDNGSLVALSENVALDNARNNAKELVLVCNF